MSSGDTMKTYDYLVIGGGSGGIASARRAAEFKVSVGLIEGRHLGGTCVSFNYFQNSEYFHISYLERRNKLKSYFPRNFCDNFQVNKGCVPKKIMYNCSRHAEAIIDHSDYGFDVTLNGFNWK